MDHQLGMALAIVGIIGFLLWIFRPQAHIAIRLLVAIPSIAWLGVYCLVELFRSEPTVWSGRAEMNIVTVLLIAAGAYVLVSKPKRAGRDGGERSA
ncbi:MAG: hypothetical protein NW204_13520 [Xanthomonadaceae bacterium]|nr:hypothetical protein [Xanthomonadaceae bacterium]